jgi:hypothetical protein
MQKYGSYAVKNTICDLPYEVLMILLSKSSKHAQKHDF